MSDWTSEYVTLIEDCEARCDRLSDWEVGFVDSLKDWIAKGKFPTPKQIETLDRIWEKVTKKG